MCCPQLFSCCKDKIEQQQREIPCLLKVNIFSGLLLKRKKKKKEGVLPSGLSSKEFACPCRILGFNPCVGKISWRRQQQPTPIFLPGKFHGRGTWRATVCGLGAKRVRHNLATKQQQQQQQQQTLLNQRRGLFSKLVFLPDVLLGREFPFEEFYDR